ncbi:hypothetical protein vseg_007406 [Gypsophila vaccaria]
MQQVMNQYQMENKASFSNIEKQMGQMASVINRLDARDKGKFPLTTVLNPNVSDITLRNEKNLRQWEASKKKDKKPIIINVEVKVTVKPKMFCDSPEGTPTMPTTIHPPPFPNVQKDTREYEKDSDTLEIFKKCEVNIPFLIC